MTTVPPTDTSASQPYDFSRPNVLSAEIAGYFAAWQESLCAMIRDRWPHLAPGQVTLSAPQLETLSFATVRNRLPRPSVAHYVANHAAKWNSLLVMERRMALAIVFEMLDEEVAELPGDRALTEVEHSLCEMFLQEFVTLLGQSWPDRQQLVFDLGDADPQPHHSRMWDPSEIVLMCRYELQGRGEPLQISWITPQRPLENLLATLTHVDHQAASDQWHEALQRHAMQLPVTVAVILGEAELNVSQLAALQVGDVVRLKQRIDEPLSAQVAEQEKFLAWPGRRGPRLAIQVESWL